MRVTYLKLENVSGLWVGSERTSLEISFKKSKNKIISIQGANGVGKTVLISSITPFASVTALDERSSLSYIIPRKQGYKEIHYQDGENTFIIKHFYKPKENTHSVKSYFTMNGEELNQNGNVKSFLALVEIHMGLTPDMMRLVRLGTNVNSFITLTPAARKEYIGKLIEEIDLYLQVHRKVNKDLIVTKALLQANDQNLYNCHITDPVIERERLKELEKHINAHNKERDQIISEIARIDSLMRDNNIDLLKKKKREAESAISEFHQVEKIIHAQSLQSSSVEDLIKRRSNLSDERSDLVGKINGYRISIDNTLRQIERLEMNVKRVTSNNDMRSLMEMIAELKSGIESTSKYVVNFVSLGSSSDEIVTFLAQLRSFNQISKMIYGLGNKPIEVYLRLRAEGRSIDKFLKDKVRKRNAGLHESDMKILFDQVFGDDYIITPNCDTEYQNCPYYRFSETIQNVKAQLEEDSYDDETLRYIQVISNNVDTILNELDRSRNIHIPDKCRDELTEQKILDHMGNKLPFFDLSDLEYYLTILKEWEFYCQRIEKLKQYESQLMIYKKSGVENQLTEIEEQRKSITFYKNNISTLEARVAEIQRQFSIIDEQIGLVTRYQNSKSTYKVFQSTLDATNKILVPLESAMNQKMELEYRLRREDDQIQHLRTAHRELEGKLREYKRLTEEGKKLEKQYNDLSLIQESVSTKKGIPVIYMKSYLGKIQQLTNELLKLIYDDDLQLASFKVTQETFEVPYIKNGTLVPDVKYASQSEVALITMALSFALNTQIAGTYNIPLLDEVDAGLDENNRSAFLKMLYMQMNRLKAEQVFMISQNLPQMMNVPMDCIILSPIAMVRSRLQHVIYE